MNRHSGRLGEHDDQTLISLFLKRSDEQALRVLYDRFTPELYRMIFRLVGWKEDDANDVLQDTWIRAMERLGQFRLDMNFRAWLWGIAINRCRELFRMRAKARNEVRGESEELEEIKILFPIAERIDLKDAIARLPDGYRAVLLLHDVEGYTHEEISEMLEIEIGTSKSQLSRARRAVRSVLKDQ